MKYPLKDRKVRYSVSKYQLQEKNLESNGQIALKNSLNSKTGKHNKFK